jgi:hypothetical protein
MCNNACIHVGTKLTMDVMAGSGHLAGVRRENPGSLDTYRRRSKCVGLKMAFVVLPIFLALMHAVDARDYQYCIVGGGPAGLQMAYLMAKGNDDFALFEQAPQPGMQFEKYPIHRTLVSINKIYTGKSNKVFNERHDWNSLLSDNSTLLMKEFSEEYYPHADDYVRYLNAYAAYVEKKVREMPKNETRLWFGARVTKVESIQEVIINDGVQVMKRGESFRLSVQLSEEAAEQYFSDRQRRRIRCGCHEVVWATGMKMRSIEQFRGHDLPGVETYEDIDSTSKRYTNESVLVLGTGNAGLETAKALLNRAGKVTVVYRKALKFAWRTHYVGHARAINLVFLDSYLLKSVDLFDGYPCDDRSIYIAQKNETNPNTGRKKLLYMCDNQERNTGHTGGAHGEHAEPAPVDLTKKPLRLTEQRLAQETDRFHSDGFDRIIFCTGFKFDAKSVNMFDPQIVPRLEDNKKFPRIKSNYESINVPGLYFAGVLQHARDYKRSAGGFIHGFRYTTRSLYHILKSNAVGGKGWPSLPMTKEEVKNGTHTFRRINEAAGTYQMFGELCDVLVFGDEDQCGPPEKDEPYARYYEEVPLSYVHIFVRKILRKLRFIAICFDYGHGSFSNMSPFSSEFIAKRQGKF